MPRLLITLAVLCLLPAFLCSAEPAKRAAALNVTVEELISPLLNLAANGASPGLTSSPAEAPFAAWKSNFDTWMADVQARAQRYPPGFDRDDK